MPRNDSRSLAVSVTWVRNPWWDGFWLLSGLPIGVALIMICPNVPPQQIFALGVAIMILESGHVVSPVVLAWSKAGLRRIVCREWGKHIVAPVGLMASCLLLPWEIVFGVYFAWNIYHFGMQIFGVSCLYCRPQSHDARVWRALGCVSVTVFAMGIWPLLIGQSPNMYLLTLGVFSFNHWLVDIGLSSQVSGWRWGFIALVLSIGVAWLLLRHGPLSVHSIPQILAIRAGIGMIHFVYSARVWKLSDPQVRATIGKELFA